jgi:hypothetical protein
MSETLNWLPAYRSVYDGEQVKADVANRPSEDLYQMILYLKSTVDSMSAGQALLITDQAVDAAAVTGTPVYLDNSGIWRPALAELSNAENSTLFQLTEKAYVTGMVLAKNNSNSATIIIQGSALFDAAVLNVIDGGYANGIFYLSNTNAGMLTSKKSAAPVRVCVMNGPDANGKYRVILNPEQRAQLDSHGHYHFRLTAEPAGDPNCVPGKEWKVVIGDFQEGGPYPGVIHVVENADSSKLGWLPIDDPSFDGLEKPAGAKFGYNLVADTALAAIWPPLPIDNVAVEVDGIGEQDDLVIVNQDGIWWMDDTYGHAPWPVNMPCMSSSSGFPYEEWPVRIELWITRAVHNTTMDAIADRMSRVAGVYTNVLPSAAGASLPLELSEYGVMGHVLGPLLSGSSSSLSPGEVPESQLIYTLASRDFSSVTQSVTFRLQFMLGGPSTLTAATISDILSGLSVTVQILSDPGRDAVDFGGSVSTLTFDTVPEDTLVVPAGKRFVVVTGDITVTARELAVIRVTWSGGVLSDATDYAYLLSVTPLIATT